MFFRGYLMFLCLFSFLGRWPPIDLLLLGFPYDLFYFCYFFFFFWVVVKSCLNCILQTHTNWHRPSSLNFMFGSFYDIMIDFLWIPVIDPIKINFFFLKVNFVYTFRLLVINLNNEMASYQLERIIINLLYRLEWVYFIIWYMFQELFGSHWSNTYEPSTL